MRHDVLDPPTAPWAEWIPDGVLRVEKSVEKEIGEKAHAPHEDVSPTGRSASGWKTVSRHDGIML
jgi:hypothetical protein